MDRLNEWVILFYRVVGGWLKNTNCIMHYTFMVAILTKDAQKKDRVE